MFEYSHLIIDPTVIGLLHQSKLLIILISLWIFILYEVIEDPHSLAVTADICQGT